MTNAATDCLEQDDLRMFYKGACHVFAVALQKYRPEQEYELRRVACDEMHAYHVYAKNGDWLVDVGGIKRERDYLLWLERRAAEHGWTCIQSEAVSETDLLRAAKVEERRGVVNEWGLFTDTDFVSKAMERGRRLVQESDRYRVDLVR